MTTEFKFPDVGEGITAAFLLRKKPGKKEGLKW